jgi:hypothetical protein
LIAVLYRTCITVSEFSRIVSRSLVLRSDKVIAYPVQVGIISRIDARVIPAILAQSSCRRAKGSGQLSRAECSTSIRSCRSSCFIVGLPVLVELLVLVEAREVLPEIDVAPCPEEEELGTLAEYKSAPEFFRVFAISAKLTDFAEGAVECWLWIQRRI